MINELKTMKRIVNVAKNTFEVELAEMLVGLDEHGLALSKAIGEISYDEALDGLVNYLKDEVNKRKLAK